MLTVGALRVDPALDEIERDGQIVKLEPRTMRLLVCLAEHAGEVVSVDELLEAVWKDVVVTPVSVYQAIAGLRRVMGDDAKRPIYIANVVRRGYRLIAPVSVWEPPVPPSPPPALLTIPPSPPPTLFVISADPLPVLPTIAADCDAPGLDAPVPAPAPARGRKFVVLLGLLLVVLAVWMGRTVWTRTHPEAVVSAVPLLPRSVAVLPFRDLSQNHDLEYMADGMMEEIINLLANVPGLRVPARTSSLYLKDKSDAREIARTLGVAHLLEGSIRRVGNNLRVTTALSRADNGYQIWSQTYEIGAGDILTIQHDIAAAVVRNLTDLILPATTLPAMSAADLEAYDAVRKARFLLSHGTDANNRQAIDVLQTALTRSPNYAVAWAQLARAHRNRASHFDETPDQNIAAAREEARKALAIDPDCGDAHNVLADIARVYDYDPAAGAREVAAVRAHSPGKADINGDLFDIYNGCVLGPCYERLIRDTQEEINDDPMNPIPYWTQSLARYVFGDLAGAEREIRHAIALSPGNGYQQFLLARILYARLDRPQLQLLAQAIPDSMYHRASLVLSLHALGRNADAEAALRDLTLHDAHDGAYQIAEVYAALGGATDAMTWLERAYRQHDASMWSMQVDPLLRDLHDDERFVALKTQLHM